MSSTDRRTDERGESSIPPSNFVGQGYKYDCQILGDMLLISQVYVFFFFFYYMLCSKTYGTFGGLFCSPAGARQTTRSAWICKTCLLLWFDLEGTRIVVPVMATRVTCSITLTCCAMPDSKKMGNTVVFFSSVSSSSNRSSIGTGSALWDLGIGKAAWEITNLWVKSLVTPHGYIDLCQVKLLACGDTLWWHRSVSTLVQVMVCCLTPLPEPMLTRQFNLHEQTLVKVGQRYNYFNSR